MSKPEAFLEVLALDHHVICGAKGACDQGFRAGALSAVTAGAPSVLAPQRLPLRPQYVANVLSLTRLDRHDRRNRSLWGCFGELVQLKLNATVAEFGAGDFIADLCGDFRGAVDRSLSVLKPGIGSERKISMYAGYDASPEKACALGLGSSQMIQGIRLRAALPAVSRRCAVHHLFASEH
jgi:hypothetical protein